MWLKLQNSLIVCKSIGIVAEWLKESRFYYDHAINLKVWFSHSSPQCRPYGGSRGAVSPLTTACAPHFDLPKLLFLEHHVTAKQQQIGKRSNHF